ncbi:hypothetical protein FJY94_06335 [Candidatus Kaiserbacteria bacterium]|nr:hypothetical protein [Candidatus Kaiserbacteria bacterium]
MRYRLSYDQIGHHIQASIDVNMMSGRDKVSLLLYLLTHLGITDKLDDNADAVITEATKRIWGELP